MSKIFISPPKSVVDLLLVLLACCSLQQLATRGQWRPVEAALGANSSWGGLCGTNLKLEPANKQAAPSELINRFAGHRFEYLQDENLRLQRLKRLQNELVVVRLNVIYDSSFKAQFGNKSEDYIRALMYQLQLYYERPEMSERIKFNFVVVNISESSYVYPIWLTANNLLNEFSTRIDQPRNSYDLSVLLIFRELIVYRQYKLISKIFGISNVGSFCTENIAPPTLVFRTENFASAVVLAHEFAHSFGCNHDGEEPHLIERRCANTNHIMNAEVDIGRLSWSWCSVRVLAERFISENIHQCIYNPARFNYSKPFKPSFDFSPTNQNINRQLLPGSQFNIDDQCALALGINAKSYPDGQNTYPTCLDLACQVGKLDTVKVSMGPAGWGSKCVSRASIAGTCWNSECK